MPVNSQNNSSAATGCLTCGAKRGNTALYVKYDVNVFVTVAYHPGKGGDITPIAAGKNDCSLAILKNAKQTQFKPNESLIFGFSGFMLEKLGVTNYIKGC